MFQNKSLYLVGLLFVLFMVGCSDSNEPDEDILKPDTQKPTIVCVETIQVSVESYENEVAVSYNTPVGTDNLPGVHTEQTAGLASGEMFPVGTTTNTFLATDAAGNTASCSFDVVVTRNEPSSNSPYFIGSNPTPEGKKWVKIENLSDEFDAATFDESKWKNTDPARWIGRAPGLFKKNTVSQTDGKLNLTADILPAPEVVNGTTFTHAGSNITSMHPAEVGTYFECRMKANKTFMSSTFWLINFRSDGVGCDLRVTELDIQECVGQITTSESWAQETDRRMASNTHSRNTNCVETPTGSAGGHELLDGKASEEYHVYAAWWKSPTEIQFFLDGEEVYTVTPKAEFNLKMYLKMVVETYDWNPVPSDGGMTGSAADRTTYYDWVRSWKLEDE